MTKTRNKNAGKAFNKRYGAAIRAVRKKQKVSSDICGMQRERLLEIEAGIVRVTSKDIQCLAQAHGMAANAYMQALARAMTKPKLTPKQKRVAIAKDVLKQIKASKFIAGTGNFCHVGEWSDTLPKLIGKKQLLKLKPKCTVCAIGAAIVSGIRLFNKINITNCEITRFQQRRMIVKFFGLSQAEQIENAFEIGRGYYGFNKYGERVYDKFKDAIKFGGRFEYSRNRAVAIFKNIIKHKGVFVP